jgi:disulfide bond formation protein DsbB
MKTASSLRWTYLFGFILITILLSVAFFLQTYEGIQPCPLCILQRIDMALLGVVFFFGIVSNVKKAGHLFISLFASLISLAGIFLSGRQVWLQHLPMDKNADCGASFQYLMHVLPLDQLITKILQGTAECSQVGSQFLYLSMAEWSLLWFIVFFILCLVQVRRASRGVP